MTTLVNKGKLLSVPSGIWPSLWVMVIAGTLVSLVGLVGLLVTSGYTGESPFLSGHRVPWFSESVIEAHMDYALQSDEYNNVIFLGAAPLWRVS